jgi:hypothetical protein
MVVPPVMVPPRSEPGGVGDEWRDGVGKAAEDGPASSVTMKRVHPWLGQYDVTSVGILVKSG